MSIEVDTITGPAFLASALINSDTSGLSPEDIKCLERFTDKIAPWYVVGIARDENGEGIESRFTWHFDLYGGDARGGDVLDYVVYKTA